MKNVGLLHFVIIYNNVSQSISRDIYFSQVQGANFVLATLRRCDTWKTRCAKGNAFMFRKVQQK